MEAQYQHTVEGQEVGQEDLNLLGENAALADDRALAELLRVPPYSVGGDFTPVIKAVMMAGFDDAEGTARTGHHSVVESSDGVSQVYVCPFRAVVGTRAAGNGKAWLRDIRTAVYANPAGSGRTTVVLDATASNHRWDLIYARVDVDANQDPKTRYVKGVDGVVAAQEIVTQLLTEVIIGVTKGVEGASPERPALLADGGGSYYIPLAYVLLEHPSASAVIPAGRIQEVAPIIQIASAAGGAPLRPCNQLYLPDGLNDASWAIASPGRPRSFLPPTLCGSLRRVVGLAWGTSGDDTPLDASTVLDDSIDWRDRVIKTTFSVFDDNLAFSWCMGSEPTPLQDSYVQLATTHHASTYGAVLPAGSFGAVADVTSARHGLASTARVTLYVDSTGRLCAQVAAASPHRGIVFWIEASGMWRDHGAVT